MVTKEQIAEKLGYNQRSMDAMRAAVTNQQRLLSRSLDKIVRVVIPESVAENRPEETLEFRTNALTEIRQAVSDTMKEIRRTVGMAQGLFYETIYDGFEAIAGVLYIGTEFTTFITTVDQWFVVLPGGGIVEVVGGSEEVMRDAMQFNKRLMFGNEGAALFVPRGQQAKMRVVHRTQFVSTFVPTPPIVG